MNLYNVLRPQMWHIRLASALFLIFTATSCSRHNATNVAGQSIDLSQLERSIQSDELWTDRFLFVALEGIKSGKVTEVTSRFLAISNSIEVLQLTADGVDCTEPVLLNRDKTMQKLVKFLEQCGVDINLIRFVQIEEKRGFIQAMILILDNLNANTKVGHVFPTKDLGHKP